MAPEEELEAELCAAQIAEWTDGCNKRCPISGMFQLFIAVVEENKILKQEIKRMDEFQNGQKGR